jgi:hypothetical protein
MYASAINAAEVFLWEPMDPDDPGFYDWHATGPNGDWAPGALNIVGPIERGDLNKILTLIKDQEYMPSFAVSSPGGNVVEAMKIGRFFRDSILNITVTDGADCFSACFLILVGATGRYLRSPIGIHRAYFDPEYFKSLSPIEAERQYRELDNFVRQYLYEMYVPEDVIAQMMATKSTEENYLSPDEFISRIGRFSPAIEEWKIANCGEITEKGRELYNRVRAVRSYEAEFLGKEFSQLHDEDQEWIRYNLKNIELGATISESDRDKISNHHLQVVGCLSDIKDKNKRNVLESIKSSE